MNNVAKLKIQKNNITDIYLLTPIQRDYYFKHYIGRNLMLILYKVYLN